MLLEAETSGRVLACLQLLDQVFIAAVAMLRFVSSIQALPSCQSDVAADIEEIADQWEMVGGVSVVVGSLCFCTQIYGLISST